jgi:hypothetical protein
LSEVEVAMKTAWSVQRVERGHEQSTCVTQKTALANCACLIA